MTHTGSKRESFGDKPARKLMSYLGFEWNQWRRKYNLEKSTAELTEGDVKTLTNNFAHHVDLAVELALTKALKELKEAIDDGKQSHSMAVISEAIDNKIKELEEETNDQL